MILPHVFRFTKIHLGCVITRQLHKDLHWLINIQVHFGFVFICHCASKRHKKNGKTLDFIYFFKLLLVFYLPALLQRLLLMWALIKLGQVIGLHYGCRLFSLNWENPVFLTVHLQHGTTRRTF